MTHLIGVQRGRLSGIELFFTTHKYAKKNLQNIPAFYQEAILKMTKLPFRIKVTDIRQEKVFYNPIFQTRLGNVLETTNRNPSPYIYTYGTIREEHYLRLTNQRYRKSVTNIFDKVAIIDIVGREDFALR